MEIFGQLFAQESVDCHIKIINRKRSVKLLFQNLKALRSWKSYKVGVSIFVSNGLIVVK